MPNFKNSVRRVAADTSNDTFKGVCCSACNLYLDLSCVESTVVSWEVRALSRNAHLKSKEERVFIVYYCKIQLLYTARHWEQCRCRLHTTYCTMFVTVSIITVDVLVQIPRNLLSSCHHNQDRVVPFGTPRIYSSPHSPHALHPRHNQQVVSIAYLAFHYLFRESTPQRRSILTRLPWWWSCQ